MSTFQWPIKVGNMQGGDMAQVMAMVDTGATHTMVPASLLARLGILPIEHETFVLGDGTKRDYGFGEARIDIDGRQRVCSVIFGPEDEYLLGATTLENFGLLVDPEMETLTRKQYRARSI